MDLFYLKQDWSDCKNSNKIRKSVNTPCPLLLTSAKSGTTIKVIQFKFLTHKKLNPRVFIPKLKSPPLDYIDSLSKIKSNQLKLEDLSRLIQNHQGENDEITSRISEQSLKLKELDSELKSKQNEISSLEQKNCLEIQKEKNLHKQTEALITDQQTQINSIKQTISKLSSDISSIMQTLASLTQKFENSQKLLTETQVLIFNKSESISLKTSSIQANLIKSSELHSLVQHDQLSIHHLYEEISKYSKSN